MFAKRHLSIFSALPSATIINTTITVYPIGRHWKPLWQVVLFRSPIYIKYNKYSHTISFRMLPSLIELKSAKNLLKSPASRMSPKHLSMRRKAKPFTLYFLLPSFISILFPLILPEVTTSWTILQLFILAYPLPLIHEEGMYVKIPVYIKVFSN